MDQYRVFGNPIAQSKSPIIHQHFAQQTDQILDYQKQLIALDAFKQDVFAFIQQGGKGANVTAPFKEEAFALCDRLSKNAQMAGAVNTLSFKDGLIYGDNTDGVGLVSDLIRNKVTLKGADILILGAGGAVKGVVQPILDQQPRKLLIANRTLSKAQAIVEQYPDKPISALSYDELDEQLSAISPDVIINATSTGLTGGIPPISAAIINEQVICYDMTYAAQLTPFLTWAKQANAKICIDGLGMLVGQAAESFKLWRSVTPDVEPVLAQLKQDLNKGK